MKNGLNFRNAPPRKKGKSWLRRLNSWLHLWLGLGSGIIVFIVALTGTVFVFCDDIIDALAGKDKLYVKEVMDTRLSPEELLAAFQKQHPEREAFYFTSYRNPQRSFRIASSSPDDELRFDWLDPYTGQNLGYGTAYYFFYVVAHVHSGEMPFGKTGNLIVHIATWIFLIELITGLVLWWPLKWTKATKKQSFTIAWKARFKRINYDLHNVPGFYSLLPALLLTVTGLTIVNHSLNKATHGLAGSQPEPYAALRQYRKPLAERPAYVPLQGVVEKLFEPQNVQQVRISLPPNDSIPAVLAVTGSDIGLKGLSGDGQYFMIDRRTGEPLAIAPKLMKGLKVDGLVMNLHIGFWGGWWGKIVTFLVGLICTALPVTGFLIWWGRRNKKKKRISQPIPLTVPETV